MTQPNFDQMSREELCAYMLEHRDDEQAFHVYMDRLATEPVLARGAIEDLQNSDSQTLNFNCRAKNLGLQD